MKIKPGFCWKCCDDVAAVGNFKTGRFVFSCLIALVIFPPLILAVLLGSGTFYEYRCPHCGEKTTKPLGD